MTKRFFGERKIYVKHLNTKDSRKYSTQTGNVKECDRWPKTWLKLHHRNKFEQGKKLCSSNTLA
jgi:hypothetical protein